MRTYLLEVREAIAVGIGWITHLILKASLVRICFEFAITMRSIGNWPMWRAVFNVAVLERWRFFRTRNCVTMDFQ